MPSLKAHIAVSGNVPKIISAVSSYDQNEKIKFSEHSLITKPKYHLFLIHLSENLESVSQNLISLYEKCRENNSKLLVCLIFDGEINRDKIKHFQNLLTDLGKTKQIHRLVVTKDLYTIKYPTIVTSLDEEIENIFKGNGINISEKGNNELLPLYINDFIEAITKILLLDSTSGKTIYVLGEPIKDLEFAYTVKNIVIDDKPNFQINSNVNNIPEDTESNNQSNSSQIDLGWSPTTVFDQSLKLIYEEIRSKKDEINEEYEKVPKNKILQKVDSIFKKISRIKYKFIPNRNRENNESTNRRRLIGKITLLVAASYLLICGVFAFSIYQSFHTLAGSLNSLKEGNIEESVFFVNKTVFFDQVAINIYWPIRPLVRLVSTDYDEELHNLFSFNQYLQSSLVNLQQTYVLSEKIYLSFLDKNQQMNIDDETLALKSSLGQIYDNLNQIDIMVNSGKLPKDLVKKLKEDPEFSKLGSLEIQLTQSMKLLNILPGISSPTLNRQIAIIVQDQDELRSLGGVIKYLIIINVDKGKLGEVKVFDQVTIDTLSDGTIKSPEIVSAVTGSDTWKFRDMSYIGDFSQTSQYLSWYLNKVLQIDPDVIISVNKSFFEKLLLKNGGINISEKNINQETIKSQVGEPDNGDLRLVIDYYISLYRNQKLSLADLSRVVINEVESSNIFFWAKDALIESSLSHLPYSGVINPFNCHSALANYETCIAQTTYLSESNFAIAPLNRNLNREVVHLISLTQNEAQHEYQIKYHFLSDFSSLNRDYRLIYQLYVSSDSNLSSVIVDDQPLLLKSFLKQKFNQFDYYQIPIALSQNTDHQVRIKFSTGISLSSDINQTAYSLTEIRQSGLYDSGFGLIINLPENTHAALVTSEVDTKPQQVFYRFPTKTSTFGVGLGLVRQ